MKQFIKFLDDYEPRIGAPATAVFNVDETRVALNEAKRAGVRLVSKAYRKSGTRGKREHQHSSIVPFVSAAGEVISVFYVLASKPGEKLVSVPHFKSLRDHTSYREYFLITPTGYTNNEVFPPAPPNSSNHLMMRSLAFSRPSCECTGTDFSRPIRCAASWPRMLSSLQ